MSLITIKEDELVSNYAVGYGWLVIKTGHNLIREIEVYVGRDNTLRRVANGEPLLPLKITDDETGRSIMVTKAD